MRASLVILWCLGIAAPAWSADHGEPLDHVTRGVRPDLCGEWVGTRNEITVTWQLDLDGRLRMDGRGADYEMRGDLLTVHFDPPAGGNARANRETAIYHFVPDGEATRMLVYGFDLGRQGLLLYRVATPDDDDRGGRAPSEGGSAGARR
jgi:hypothetical protein